MDASDFAMGEVLRNDEQQIEDGLVLKEETVYVPKDKELNWRLFGYINSRIQRIVEDSRIGH